MKNPKAKMWFMLAITTVIIGLALFISAGTENYWQAWVYLGVVVVTGILITLYTVKDPILLESRTKVGPTAEQRPMQKIILWCMALPWIALFIIPGLDHRFGWSSVPSWISIAGNLLIVLSMWLVYRVFKVNSFGSATVEVTNKQKVISTGPYAIVRNPMYSIAVVYCIAMSLALGSCWALIPSVLVALGFIWRLFDEEKMLAKDLPGYTEYQAKVRWHLIPGIF
jgi:protein-S-isoprenylcysteine O-methyltransferase Ste14